MRLYKTLYLQVSEKIKMSPLTAARLIFIT